MAYLFGVGGVDLSSVGIAITFWVFAGLRDYHWVCYAGVPSTHLDLFCFTQTIRFNICIYPLTQRQVHFAISGNLLFICGAPQNGTTPLAIAASPNGQWLAVFGADYHLRIFSVRKAKLSRVYLETLQVFLTLKARGQGLE